MPRAFDEQRRRINLPRPPVTVRPGETLPRPAISPNPTPDIRARRDELVRPVAPPTRLIPKVSLQAPSAQQPVPPVAPPSPAPTPPPTPPAGRPQLVGGPQPQVPGIPQVDRRGQTIPLKSEDQQTLIAVPPDARPGASELAAAGIRIESSDDLGAASRSLSELGDASRAAMGLTPAGPPKSSPLGPSSPVERFSAGLQPGENVHLREIAFGADSQGLSPDRQAAHERGIVRQFQRFGKYSGSEDPNSPPPPIRPGRASFNPTTGQWVLPEGQVSVLDRLIRQFRG